MPDNTVNYETLQWWPLILVVEDCYVPELAGQAIMQVKSLPEEAFSLLWGFAADRARDEVVLN